MSVFEYSPLMMAAEYGHLEVVKYLANHGADVNFATLQEKWTALMGAGSYIHYDVVKYLVDEKHANVNAQNRYGQTVLSLVENEHLYSEGVYLGSKGYSPDKPKIIRFLVSRRAYRTEGLFVGKLMEKVENFIRGLF